MNGRWLLATLFFGAAGLACASAPDGDPTTGSTQAALRPPPPASLPSYFSIEACAPGTCEGYSLRSLNTEGPLLDVASLDLDRAGVDPTLVTSAPPAELVLYGVLESPPPAFRRVLVVARAYRGMPGIVVTPDQNVFSVSPSSAKQPAGGGSAMELNTAAVLPFDALDLGGVGHRVQLDWLVASLAGEGAIAAASRETSGAGAVALAVGQVFLLLPERLGPCPDPALPACESGLVATFTRNSQRCLLPTGCAKPGACPEIAFPPCDDGYLEVSWATAPNTCSLSVCDPAWVPEESALGSSHLPEQ